MSSTGGFIIGCSPVTFQKQRSGHYFLKTIVITWPDRRVSLACIASAAFKSKGESIVAEDDRRHISRQTGLNAYIKSESVAGTGNISYPGVRRTCRPQPAFQGERGGGRFVILCRSAKAVLRYWWATRKHHSPWSKIKASAICILFYS